MNGGLGASGSMFAFGIALVVLSLLFTLFVVACRSVHKIGDVEVGLVSKNFSRLRLSDGNPIAFNGEAGFQAQLLMPGWRFALWPIYSVTKFPWVQVPAGQVGVVIAQVGRTLPTGAKSAVFKPEFGDFSNIELFVTHGGEKGLQRPVLPPGSLVPLHPAGFLVITKDHVFGQPVNEEFAIRARRGQLTCLDFGLEPTRLDQVQIQPRRNETGKAIDVCGIVTTYEGAPVEEGSVASRLGGFDDLLELKKRAGTLAERIESLIGSKNKVHNNYQDFQLFIDAGGKIGLQHDPLLYGAYNLNPFLVSVEIVPMLVVNQGEVAVIKAFIGLPTEDTSGASFKYGSIVEPGHRGIWCEPLRTGKYAINPRCYQAEVVPTSIVTLNWADAVSKAHALDTHLSKIVAKSREGFVFSIDLQVQIHVPDTKASWVISMVGTIQNLVNEILQAAVGNHFRDKLQAMSAIRFIEERQAVQEEALHHIADKLGLYFIETKGVYIQDVVFPPELVLVLTEREIAEQRVETFKKQRLAEEERILMEASRGRADQQAALAVSEVGIEIQRNNADARKAQADGESDYIARTGKAAAAEVEAKGLAQAKAYREQVDALGSQATAMVNVVQALAGSGSKLVPEVLVTGEGKLLDGLAAMFMKQVGAVK